jgi:hypothetical protein
MVGGDVAEAAEARTRAARRALIAAAAAAFVLLRLSFLSIPLERDEGEYAYIAQRALLGEVPYRDAFDQKPPAIFAVYLAAFALFGPSVEGIHAFLYLWTVATCAALFDLVRRASDGLAAGFALLCFAVVSIEPRLTATAANTEVFMLLPLVASTGLLLRGVDGDRSRTWLACGALAAAACWFKPVAALNAAFVALFAALCAHAFGGALRRLALLAAGAGIVSAPVLLLFAGLGAWPPFVDAVFVHNVAYATRISLGSGLRHAAWSLAQQAPALAGVWALAALGLLLPRTLAPRSRALLGGFALASAAGVASGFYFRTHYFVQLLPALAALAGVAAAAACRPLLARGAAVGWSGLCALALLLVAPPVLANRALLGAAPERISREIYGLNPFVESPRIGAYIRRTSDPDDTVYVIGSEPQILFHAERRSATRYIFFYPLTAPFPDALERQRSVLREVEAARPLYVVWVHLPASMLVFEESESWIFDASADFIDRGYRLEFLARPPQAGADEFEFVYGAEARALLAAARSEGTATPWVAVFRRAS